jgi:tetratricopeptide (TPR) repeat protein
MELAEIEKLIGEQFKGKDKLIAPNIHALHMGRDFAKTNFECPIGLRVRRASAVGDRIFLDGNASAALGCVYGGATAPLSDDVAASHADAAPAAAELPPALEPPEHATADSAPPEPPPLLATTPASEALDDAAVEAAYAARDFDRAIELAARIAAVRTPDARRWTRWARALANAGRLADAARVIVSALDAGATAELLYLHAVVLLHAGRAADAVAAARRALYMDRDLIVAHLTLAEARRRTGHSDDARRALRNAASLLAHHPPASIVPASDGESAGRLAQMVRANLRLLGNDAPEAAS